MQTLRVSNVFYRARRTARRQGQRPLRRHRAAIRPAERPAKLRSAPALETPRRPPRQCEARRPRARLVLRHRRHRARARAAGRGNDRPGFQRKNARSGRRAPAQFQISNLKFEIHPGRRAANPVSRKLIRHRDRRLRIAKSDKLGKRSGRNAPRRQARRAAHRAGFWQAAESCSGATFISRT